MISKDHSLFLPCVIEKKMFKIVTVDVSSHCNILYFCGFLFCFSLQLYKEIEICQKITQHIQIEKSDTSSDIYGEFLLDFFFTFLLSQS